MRILIKALLIILFVACPAVQGGRYATEEEIKAAFIYHFINYTEWNDNLSKFYVCIPDDVVFRVRARNILENKNLKGREIKVVDYSRGCHVLVAPYPPRDDDMITIGELSRGALFEFRIIDNKLKFAANLAKVNDSKLKISSQLLKLAIVDE